MATTLAQLRTRLQARGYATDTATPQTEMINSVYRYIIGLRRWPFLEVANDTSITTTVDDGIYDLTTITDLLHVDAVRAEINTNEFYPMQHKPYQEFRSFQHGHRENGSPVYWTRTADNLHIWPEPDRAYTLNIDYIKDPVDLTTDADTIVIPDAYADVLVWGPIQDLTYRERDPEGYAMAQDKFGAILLEMMHQYGVRQRQSSDQVRYSGTYDHLSPPGLFDAEDLLWQIW